MNIHYISPYRTDKNLGKAINNAIAQLNAADEDWIIHTDQDICFLLPDTKSRIERILSTTKYDLLGPVTNRLAMPYQCVNGMFDVWDIREHVKVAQQIQSDKVEPYSHILAAFCLCFKVKTWKQLSGFAENTIQFDTMFSLIAEKVGLRKGVMTGVYLFHAYRPLSTNPRMDVTHLLPEV